MASTTQLDRQQRVDTLISEKFCIPTRAAVKKFGQVALEQQRDSIKNAALKCLEGKLIFKQYHQ